MNLKLGINLNCFTNRYTEPEEWTDLIVKLGLHYVQFNADLMDPFLPPEIQEPIIKKTVELCRRKNITIVNSFGGHHHHQHYLGHPNNAVALWYEEFYKKLIRQTALLGGKGVGTCFAIMSVNDAENPDRKQRILRRAAQSYQRLSQFAKQEGLQYLLFETTSVSRESCADFRETDFVLDLCQSMEVPMRICLDIGHRNMKDPAAPEASYTAWIQRYGRLSPVIHLQQTDKKASSHWPFTQEYNSRGDIMPDQMIEALGQSGATDCLLAFETKHKAFHPDENLVLEDLNASVQYWRKWVKQ